MRKITWFCFECGQKLSATEDKAGKGAKCPRCGTEVAVPSAPESPESHAPPPAQWVDRMVVSRASLLWPVTALVCALFLSIGIYCGLKDDRPVAGPGAQDTTEATVYVTRTGECYHRAGCSSLRMSKIPMPLSQAKQRYRPCLRCNPPR